MNSHSFYSENELIKSKTSKRQLCKLQSKVQKQLIMHIITINSFFNVSRRMSLQVAWIKKLSEQLEWVQPMDQLLKHLRYCVAVVLLIAALIVFTSTFILPHTRLGR